MSNEIQLGKIITGKANKDAIHIAVAPITAHRSLQPGEHIGVKNGEESSDTYEKIGIVDPFLKKVVNKGEKFYIFLYQYSITGMRHEWEHPYFVKVKSPEMSPSVAWLTHYASIFGLNYESLIEACNNYLDNAKFYCLGNETPDEAWRDNEEMWNHFETVTGRKVEDNKRNNFFRCAC